MQQENVTALEPKTLEQAVRFAIARAELVAGGLAQSLERELRTLFAEKAAAFQAKWVDNANVSEDFEKFLREIGLMSQH